MASKPDGFRELPVQRRRAGPLGSASVRIAAPRAVSGAALLHIAPSASAPGEDYAPSKSSTVPLLGAAPKSRAPVDFPNVGSPQRHMQDMDVSPTPAVDGAFRQLFEACRPVVIRILRRKQIPAPDVTDLAQVVFLLTYPCLPSREKPAGWAAGVARRVASEHLRNERVRERALDRAADPSLVPSRPSLSPERARLVVLLFALIDEIAHEDCRVVLDRHYRRDESLVAIAGTMGRPEGTVRSLLHQGHELLRDALDRHEAQERRRRVTRRAVLFPLFLRLDFCLPKDLPSGIEGRLRHLAEPPRRFVSAPLAHFPMVVLIGAPALVVLGLASDRARSPRPVVEPEAVACSVEASPRVQAAPSMEGAPDNEAALSVQAASSIVPTSAVVLAPLASEHRMLDHAQDALLSRDSGKALASIAAQRRVFQGRERLSEWSETLEIKALIAAGRGDDAKVRIERFATAYPHDPQVQHFRAQISAKLGVP
jgi:RNA polymerase sigma factor (sigma-70 family)